MILVTLIKLHTGSLKILVFNFKTTECDAALARLNEILAMEDSRALFQERRRVMLTSRIDTTEWMIDYIDRVVREAGS